MVRIRDVARRAGVSTATVSRVINGQPVGESLAQAVHAAVKDLGYVPHAAARSLRRGQSDVIALVVPDISNPFFTTIARRVEDSAQESGYSVVVCNTDDDPAKERRYLDLVARENMAGVIIAPSDSTPSLAPLMEQGRAIVVIDREVDHDVEQITFDNRELGRRATRALLERGLRHIVCITGPRTTSTAVQRAQGWREELQRAGVEPAQEDLVYANFRVDGGREVVERMLAQGRLSPGETAILATNNLVGVGVLQALASAGPGDTGVEVGVIGDLPFATSDLRTVAITSLEPARLGERAIARLLELINVPAETRSF